MLQYKTCIMQHRRGSAFEARTARSAKRGAANGSRRGAHTAWFTLHPASATPLTQRLCCGCMCEHPCYARAQLAAAH